MLSHWTANHKTWYLHWKLCWVYLAWFQVPHKCISTCFHTLMHIKHTTIWSQWLSENKWNPLHPLSLSVYSLQYTLYLLQCNDCYIDFCSSFFKASQGLFDKSSTVDSLENPRMIPFRVLIIICNMSLIMYMQVAIFLGMKLCPGT